MLEVKDEGPFFSDITEGSDTLVIFFGGAAGGLGKKETPFEFLRATEHEPYSKFYLRDSNQSQYQKGLEGLTTDVLDTVRFLKKRVAKAKTKNVICVGNCMGAFAAIYFGARLKAKAVHAFSPVTTIDTMKRFGYGDHRAFKLSLRLLFIGTDKDSRDVNCLKAGLLKNTAFFLHYCPDYGPDARHVGRLKQTRRFTLLEYPGNDHFLAKRLREKGLLLRTISETDTDAVKTIWRKAVKAI